MTRLLRAAPLLLLAHCALLAPSRPDDLTLSTLDGQPVRLGDVRTPVTAVVVWASYCMPCREELPLIEALHRSYAGDPDVSVITVSVDRPRNAITWANKLGLTAPVVLDRSFLFHPTVGLDQTILPLFVIFDRDGKVAFRETGFREAPAEAFVAAKRAQIEAVRRQRPGGSTVRQ